MISGNRDRLCAWSEAVEAFRSSYAPEGTPHSLFLIEKEPGVVPGSDIAGENIIGYYH